VRAAAVAEARAAAPARRNVCRSFARNVCGTARQALIRRRVKQYQDMAWRRCAMAGEAQRASPAPYGNKPVLRTRMRQYNVRKSGRTVLWNVTG